MECVKCNGKLRQVELEGVIVDQCASCAGIWFDSGELLRILGMKSVDKLRSIGAANNKTDDEKRARCPRCQGEGKLVQVARWASDIHIDTCAVCGGQWLDAGELSILRQEGGLRPVVAFFRRLFSS